MGWLMDGIDLFEAYIRDKKKSEVAAELHVSPSVLYYWLKRAQKPREAMRIKIEKWSKGAVPASSWLEAKEIASIAAQEEDSSPPASERTPRPGKDKAAS